VKRAETDDRLSFTSTEFVWNEGGMSAAHRYLRPAITNWLRDCGAKTVLDLGCGNGALTNELSRSGFSMTGMDASHTAIRIAQEQYPTIQFLKRDVNAALDTMLHGSFDAVIAVEVVEHLLLPRRLFERAKEALRPRGSFLLTTPYHGYLKNLALAVTNSFDQHWHPLRDHGHVKFFSHNTLTQLFSEQSFDVRRVRRLGRIPPFAKSIIVQGQVKPGVGI